MSGDVESKDVKVQPTEDAWNVNFETDAKKWADMDGKEKAIATAVLLLKLSVVLGSLYFFICSLSFLASGFRLVAGRQAGEVFRNSELFNNGVAGCLIGVLVTVLVQSSSTSTSIVITMVAADLFNVRQAIYLIMGANIGTSVTSTIVAVSESGDKDEFRRAMAAATVHDMFNFLNTAVLLPIEAATGYLRHFSGALISDDLSAGAERPPDFLANLTRPFIRAVMRVSSSTIRAFASARTPEEIAALDGRRVLVYLFGEDGLRADDISDVAAGVIVLVLALAILCTTLFLIVYTLKLILRGRIAALLHRTVNGHIPDAKCGSVTIPLGWLTGYLAIGVGVLVTIGVQSSSITTSALTPLVGVGVLKLERMYPVVCGANIGTCVTGLLAALAADPDRLHVTLQVALAHLLFNITGIVIWYVIWPLRALPINAAKAIGDLTAKYPWFCWFYLISAFLVIPLIFMGFSYAGQAALVTVIVIVVTVLVFVWFVNLGQRRFKDKLPVTLQTWDFLPEPLRSLEPYDRSIFGPMNRACCTPMCNAKRACCMMIPGYKMFCMKKESSGSTRELVAVTVTTPSADASSSTTAASQPDARP